MNNEHRMMKFNFCGSSFLSPRFRESEAGVQYSMFIIGIIYLFSQTEKLHH